jgi:hypothetical protein
MAKQRYEKQSILIQISPDEGIQLREILKLLYREFETEGLKEDRINTEELIKKIQGLGEIDRGENRQFLATSSQADILRDVRDVYGTSFIMLRV